MKTWKLVSGIISTVLSVFVVFQSMMAGLANALEESGQSSGSAGLVVSICMLCGGIVSIVSRKNNSKGTNIALIILFGLATFTGFVLAGNYSDLYMHMVFLVFDQYNTCNHFIKKRYQKLKLIPFKL
ncbi:hypothetical protein [uncultured Holdemanella sp.]|uniref:hypothetical protein n=1 Tax=uncultured Holdemanella sp. TaxID=1763549 RepID=UPI0025895FDD|nr:hypothetical protein [uncultured Holdemanella sp.]